MLWGCPTAHGGGLGCELTWPDMGSFSSRFLLPGWVGLMKAARSLPTGKGGQSKAAPAAPRVAVGWVHTELPEVGAKGKQMSSDTHRAGTAHPPLQPQHRVPVGLCPAQLVLRIQPRTPEAADAAFAGAVVGPCLDVGSDHSTGQPHCTLQHSGDMVPAELHPRSTGRGAPGMQDLLLQSPLTPLLGRHITCRP